ncbi:hypothetical protein E1B28_005116 [Marasmius oreades]|uniref:Uncharacterized protein n=1 Tax=Marasmius oreades TaxID=181124 RepID=A0A9P8ADN8_9AGAR|nr:uncharacterized protein E1B28_005116 [Marasmius oreades]KAG7097797.1 hypothetical protein E1B28_005116 [Marasmius oreades]
MSAVRTRTRTQHDGDKTSSASESTPFHIHHPTSGWSLTWRGTRSPTNPPSRPPSRFNTPGRRLVEDSDPEEPSAYPQNPLAVPANFNQRSTRSPTPQLPTMPNTPSPPPRSPPGETIPDTPTPPPSPPFRNITNMERYSSEFVWRMNWPQILLSDNPDAPCRNIWRMIRNRYASIAAQPYPTPATNPQTQPPTQRSSPESSLRRTQRYEDLSQFFQTKPTGASQGDSNKEQPSSLPMETLIIPPRSSPSDEVVFNTNDRRSGDIGNDRSF